MRVLSSNACGASDGGGRRSCYSDASAVGRWIALLLVVAVAVFALVYSTMAIRALADPQPGSSLSAVSGTSFTL